MVAKFKIEFKKQQVYMNFDVLQPVLVSCDGFGNAVYTPGTIPDNDWIDMSAYTEGLEKIKLTWQAFEDGVSASDGTDQASINQFGSNYRSAVSSELGFYGVAFDYIYDWLMTTPCQILNAVNVRITDMDSGRNFRIFSIKTDTITYSPFDAQCFVKVPLKEVDLSFNAFQKTIIEDDWQYWFNATGTSTKKHPIVSYAVEKRPHFMLSALIALVYITGMLSGAGVTLITEWKRWVHRVMGVYYFSPAPLIYSYIQNVCDKYGYTYNTMFNPGNIYSNVVMFFPVENFVKNFDDAGAPAGTNIYNYSNRTGLAFSQFLDQLKKVFNAEWYITPGNELVFQNKAYFNNLTPIYDFTAANAVKFYNLTYTFDGNKKAAYGDYRYKIDPQDTCSNDLRWRYCDIVDYDGPANNPMLQGSVVKEFDFASTSFMYDGDTTDWMEEAIEAGRLVAFLAILVGFGILLTAINLITAAVTVALVTLGYLATNGYFTSNFINNPDIQDIVRISSNVVNIPRLLILNLENANLDMPKKTLYTTNPIINPYYNLSGQDYYQTNPSYDAPGGYFGTTVTHICNYQLMVDAKFTNNLFDICHETDNPLKNPLTNQSFEMDIDLCRAAAELLGFYEGDSAQIGAIIIIENRSGRLIRGRITEIAPDYEKGNIHIKGTVLK